MNSNLSARNLSSPTVELTVYLLAPSPALPSLFFFSFHFCFYCSPLADYLQCAEHNWVRSTVRTPPPLPAAKDSKRRAELPRMARKIPTPRAGIGESRPGRQRSAACCTATCRYCMILKLVNINGPRILLSRTFRSCFQGRPISRPSRNSRRNPRTIPQRRAREF